jgi:hypothetical protein
LSFARPTAKSCSTIALGCDPELGETGPGSVRDGQNARRYPTAPTQEAPGRTGLPDVGSAAVTSVIADGATCPFIGHSSTAPGILLGGVSAVALTKSGSHLLRSSDAERLCPFGIQGQDLREVRGSRSGSGRIETRYFKQYSATARPPIFGNRPTGNFIRYRRPAAPEDTMLRMPAASPTDGILRPAPSAAPAGIPATNATRSTSSKTTDSRTALAILLLGRARAAAQYYDVVPLASFNGAYGSGESSPARASPRRPVSRCWTQTGICSAYSTVGYFLEPAAVSGSTPHRTAFRR